MRARTTASRLCALLVSACGVRCPLADDLAVTWELPTRLEHCVDSGPVLDRQDDGISLNEAIERVRRLPDFRRLLSASTEARGNREVHFVKYMAQDGTVRRQSFTGRRR